MQMSLHKIAFNCMRTLIGQVIFQACNKFPKLIQTLASARQVLRQILLLSTDYITLTTLIIVLVTGENLFLLRLSLLFSLGSLALVLGLLRSTPRRLLTRNRTTNHNTAFGLEYRSERLQSTAIFKFSKNPVTNFFIGFIDKMLRRVTTNCVIALGRVKLDFSTTQRSIATSKRRTNSFVLN